VDCDERLLAVLCAHLDRHGLRFTETLQPLQGGYSNEIFRFRLEDATPRFDQPLVLRLTHDERDTAREGIIENGVAERGFPAPPVLVRGGSSSAFGAPFLITQLSPGVAFDETITARTAIGALRRLPDQLAAAMLALHKVPTENIAAGLTAEGWEPDRLDSLAVLADIDDYADQRTRLIYGDELPCCARTNLRSLAPSCAMATCTPSTFCSKAARSLWSSTGSSPGSPILRMTSDARSYSFDRRRTRCLQ
jgi:Phosphotransferase enzyme family